VLAADLAETEDPLQLLPEAAYPVWSPFRAPEAAATLLGVLEAETVRP
jgi:hypothetical protein